MDLLEERKRLCCPIKGYVFGKNFRFECYIIGFVSLLVLLCFDVFMWYICYVQEHSKLLCGVIAFSFLAILFCAVLSTIRYLQLLGLKYICDGISISNISRRINNKVVLDSDIQCKRILIAMAINRAEFKIPCWVFASEAIPESYEIVGLKQVEIMTKKGMVFLPDSNEV